jgi:hypothetical protein
MQPTSWNQYESWSIPELEQRLATVEALATNAYRAGEPDLGHGYYLTCCEIGMALAFREGCGRLYTADRR